MVCGGRFEHTFVDIRIFNLLAPSMLQVLFLPAIGNMKMSRREPKENRYEVECAYIHLSHGDICHWKALLMRQPVFNIWLPFWLISRSWILCCHYGLVTILFVTFCYSMYSRYLLLYWASCYSSSAETSLTSESNDIMGAKFINNQNNLYNISMFVVFGGSHRWW